MARVRRSRAPSSSSGDGNGDANTSSSTSRSAMRKRRRTSYEGSASVEDERNSRHFSTQSAGEVIESPLDPAPNATSSRREDYLRMRDGSKAAVDEDVEQEKEVVLTQMIRQQHHERTLEPENPIAENGVIETVTCTNFMCHNKLTVSFGPLINFIIGHNGSGKSAVLTAITLCLGGKATSTNRGQSLKSFVKEGQESCTLEVKLKNQGDGAYRQDVYGDSIIVERHFSIHGTSGFKIKSATGRLISTKRAELDDISDHYNLQLDNPVNVLTQDMARQFLNNSSDVEKYKFFLKGVQLEQLDRDYLLVIESLEGADSQLENLSEACKELEETASEAAAKLRASENQNSLREKVRKYQRQMAWAQVEEQEGILEELDSDIRRTTGKIEQGKEDAKPMEDAYQAAHHAFEEQNAKTAQLRQGVEPLEQQKSEPQEEFEKIQKELQETLVQQRQIHHSLSDRRRVTIKRLEKDIKDEEARMMNADGGAQAQKLTEIKEAEEAEAEAQQRRADHRESLPRLEQEKDAALHRALAAEKALSGKREELEDAESRLVRLQQDQGKRLAAYHPTLPALLKAIQSESRFHMKPIGPMGNHIRLLKPDWSRILETYLGPALNGFVVTDKHDQQLLAELMRKTRCSYQIFIGGARHLDTSPHEPNCEYDTIMKALEIESDMIRSHLIINIGIEQVVLIPSRVEAEEFMFSNGRQPNVKVALCFHDHRSDSGVRFSWGPGGQKSDPVRAWGTLPRMKTDTEIQIRLQKETVHNLKQQVNQQEGQVRTVRGEETKCSQAIKRHHRDGKELQIAYERAHDLAQQLKDELEQAKPQDGKLEGLKAELEKTHSDQEIDQGQYDQSRIVMEELHQRQEALQAKIDEYEKQYEKLQEKIAKSGSRVKRLAEKREAALFEKNKALDLVEAEKQNLGRLQEERGRQAEDVESFISQASTICSRVPVDAGETGDTLEKKLERLEVELQRAEREIGGDPRAIHEQAHATRKKWDRARKQKALLEGLVNAMTRATAERRDRWDHFRGAISLRARAQFRDLLEERAFRGRMALDHKNKKLQLLVEPNGSLENATGRQTATLSGGEKSFSTLCLVLALWEAMASPIRCLDEFDVFMDSVNRATSMRMLVNAARRSPGRQFIFITPQSMGNVDFGPDVKVHKMTDPERGQTTLNFGAAAAAANSRNGGTPVPVA